MSPQSYLKHPSSNMIDQEPIEGPIISLIDADNISNKYSLIQRVLTTYYYPRVRHTIKSMHYNNKYSPHDYHKNTIIKNVILKCAEHVNCWHRTRYDVTTREPVGDEEERQCSIQCSYQGRLCQ